MFTGATRLRNLVSAAETHLDTIVKYRRLATAFLVRLGVLSRRVGFIGGWYARRYGEPEVSGVLEESYLPPYMTVGNGGRLP